MDKEKDVLLKYRTLCLYNIHTGKERIMNKIKNKKVMIHTSKDFVRIYLPKPIKGTEVDATNKIDNFGIDLASKIMKKIDIKT